MSINKRWLESLIDFQNAVRRGVISGDIELVKQAWEEFTGETIVDEEKALDEEPEERTERDNQKEEESFEMPKVEKKKGKQRLASKQQINTESARENEFSDDGTLGLDEAGADIINDSAKPPTKRTRTPAKTPIDAMCYVCGRPEKVHPSQYREHYRCSNCCRG
tara:strand:+ start:32494 stop:32985 length:492 start_codon:yes stop_codon:yes gene_type:complete